MQATEFPPAFFPYNTIESVWTSQLNNSSTIGPNDLKFDKEPQYVVHHNIPKFRTNCS